MVFLVDKEARVGPESLRSLYYTERDSHCQTFQSSFTSQCRPAMSQGHTPALQMEREGLSKGQRPIQSYSEKATEPDVDPWLPTPTRA